jgi:hypothetical protein
MNILAEIIVTYYGTVYRHFMTTGSPNMCLWHQIISKPSSLSCLGNEKSGKERIPFTERTILSAVWESRKEQELI